MLRSFRTSWDDRLKWLCKHIIFPFVLQFLISYGLPRLFQSLAMTVLGCCHCEEQCDEAIHKHTHPFVIASEAKQSTNHYFLIHSQKNKKINHRLPLCHCEEWNDEAIHKHTHPFVIASKKSNSSLLFFVIARSKTTKQSTNHKKLIQKTKKKKNSLLFIKLKN